jgi:L-lactate dehydrogenase complex protein LldF
MHVVIVDNGRSAILARETFRRSLTCIRCGACMNTCPVFRRSGGHSYGYSVPGPIGSLLAPLRDPVKYAGLPFASSLCGSCTHVCPVKIDLHQQLLAFRQELVERKAVPFRKRFLMRLVGLVLAHPWAYRFAGKLMRSLVPRLPRFLVQGPWNAWGRQRELPDMPRESFREMMRRGGA